MPRRNTKHTLRAIRAKSGVECPLSAIALLSRFTLPNLPSNFDKLREHEKLRELAKHLRFTPLYT